MTHTTCADCKASTSDPDRYPIRHRRDCPANRIVKELGSYGTTTGVLPTGNRHLEPGTYTIDPKGMIFDIKDGEVHAHLAPDANPIPIPQSPPRPPMRHVKKDPLKGHPRAEETRQAMLQARFDDEQEVVELQSSELACAVADAWATDRMASRCASVFDNHPNLARALDRIERVTRPSEMRKVRP